MTDEMRVRREIKFAEKEHQENLDRASEASALGENLAASFKKKNCLDRDDIKKLDKLEKLAKRIRSEAGGSEDDLTIEEKPKDLQEAMTLLAKVSASLNHKIQETPRRVISAEIIERANVLLELVRIVRNISGKV
jgi:nitric oxide reductase activation protein